MKNKKISDFDKNNESNLSKIEKSEEEMNEIEKVVKLYNILKELTAIMKNIEWEKIISEINKLKPTKLLEMRVKLVVIFFSSRNCSLNTKQIFFLVTDNYDKNYRDKNYRLIKRVLEKWTSYELYEKGKEEHHKKWGRTPKRTLPPKGRKPDSYQLNPLIFKSEKPEEQTYSIINKFKDKEEINQISVLSRMINILESKEFLPFCKWIIEQFVFITKNIKLLIELHSEKMENENNKEIDKLFFKVNPKQMEDTIKLLSDVINKNVSSLSSVIQFVENHHKRYYSEIKHIRKQIDKQLEQSSSEL